MMRQIEFKINDFNLTSSWTVSMERYLDENGDEQRILDWSTPTTASKTVTVDTSAIPKNAKIISAVFSGSTNGTGESYATAGGVKKNITNAFEKDAMDWLADLPDSLQIKFTYQSKIIFEYSSLGPHSTVSAFKNMALVVTYEGDEPGGVDETTINIAGGESFLC